MNRDKRTNQIHRLGIELTLRCQLRCPQCDHHCDLAGVPSIADSDMSLGQIDRFIGEVKSTDTLIIRLTATGGEVTLHPHLHEVIRMLHAELILGRYVARPLVRMITNGIAKPPEGIEKWCIIKTLVPLGDRRNRHFAMWQAPRDTGQPVSARRRNRGLGCDIPFRCGTVLNKWGYWPCGPGGAICRRFGLTHWARFGLPIAPWDDGTWDLGEFASEVCSLCQYAAGRNYRKVGNWPDPSPSFARTFAMESPILRMY